MILQNKWLKSNAIHNTLLGFQICEVPHKYENLIMGYVLHYWYSYLQRVYTILVILLNWDIIITCFFMTFVQRKQIGGNILAV